MTYHADHLGSTNWGTDSDGGAYEHFQYTPYGEPWVDESFSNKLATMTHRFTGQELDRETGLYSFPARYYDPQTSRWMGADPAGSQLMMPMDREGNMRAGFSIVESTNWYSYVSNNPLKYSDPTGMKGANEINWYEEGEIYDMQSGMPFDFEFAQYRASIMDIIYSPDEATRQAMEDSVGPGIAGMSEERYGALQATWLSIHDEIRDVRLEVSDVLGDFYQTGKRLEGVGDESALMFALTVPLAAGEAKMGSAQGLAELADSMVGYGQEALSLGRDILTFRARIHDLIADYQTLSSQLDSVTITLFGERKRRSMVGER